MIPILECKNLTKAYHKNENVLNNITISLNQGRIIGLLGPNGSGKSTLIKLAAGLLTPTKGDIFINGLCPCAVTKASVSYLPDRTYLSDLDWMKIREVIRLFCTFYQDFDPKKAYKLLADLDINPDARLKNLSKGNKEKVELILVMSRNAKLYLLDEPIGGVDPAARNEILSAIIQNYHPNSTILLSTHLIADVEDILDDVIFIKKGELILYDSASHIRSMEGKSVDELFREVFKC